MEKNKWLDISDEVYREYVYDNGFVLRVDGPTALNISESSLGGHAHRIQTEAGLAHYVASGWKAIRWAVKPGRSQFKF